MELRGVGSTRGGLARQLTGLGGAQAASSRLRSQRYTVLAAHAAIVAVLVLGVLAARPWQPSVDANIGGDIAMLFLRVAGLPWTVFVPAFGGAAKAHPGAVAIENIGALLNVVIHAVWVLWKNVRESETTR